MIKITMANGYIYHCKGIGREPGNKIILLFDEGSLTLLPETTQFIHKIEFDNGMTYTRMDLTERIS